MQIPLEEFEQYIDETILKRGFSYFKKGYVHELEEIRHGEYEAIVEGAEDYEVRLIVQEGIITQQVCDCPFDQGPVCKHIAAVIYYLNNEVLDLNKNANKAKTGQKPKPPTRKTITEQVDELLEKVSLKELKLFVRDNAIANYQFRNLFLSSFSQNNPNETKELYAKQVKAILKSASDKYGFIDWSASKHVGNAIGKFLESAWRQAENNNYKSAVLISIAVMEQLTEALQYSDDSNGDIGGNIDSAYELLYGIAQEEISEEIRKFIIEYCFDSFEKRIFSGWDWHIGVLHLAYLLLKTDVETEHILMLIDNAQESDYVREEAQILKYYIINKTKGAIDAEEYLEKNISNPKLRREAIQSAISMENFEKAISLAKDGVRYDMQDKPGLVKEWYDWLLKISQAQNDSEKIIEYARYLLIDNFRKEQDYYQILKHHVVPEEWIEFIEEVIKDIKTKNHWLDRDLIAGIFIQEKWWDRLLGLVKESPDLYTIDHYEQYLSKAYTNEIVELYADGILKLMKTGIGRSHYQNACRYIRKIIKLGAREKAIEVISHLRSEYPKRKALMQELNKL